MRYRFGFVRARARQRAFPFRARRERRERMFRASIAVATIIGLAVVWSAMASGRAALTELARRGKWAAMRGIGLEPPREEVDAYWRDRRDRREAATVARYRDLFDRLTPERRAFVRAAGMGPEAIVIRWGNYDMSLAVSSKVFARDDDGRYYKLRPGVRSAWMRQISVFDMVTCQFLVPTTPDVLRAAEVAGAKPMPGTEQTTNSWGCRGPEPDVSAPVRILVLGDSYMQGVLLGDDETPPACLARELRAALGVPVSVLNTGVLGYGPEHEFHTLRAFEDRFRPRMVVLSVFVNDFGEEPAVLRGEGDWAEAGYWFERIQMYCRARGAPCLIVPIPWEGHLTGPRNTGDYPARIANAARVSGPFFLDPTDALVTEELALRRANRLAGRSTPDRSPLYNGHIGDGHLSARGAAAWGRIVAERLALILERTRLNDERPAAGTGSR